MRTILGAAAACAAVGVFHAVSWAQTVPGGAWQTVSPSSVGMNATKLQAAVDFAQQKGAGHILISRQGKRVKVSNAGNIATNVDIKSSTKSYGGVLLCLALQDGLVTLDAHAASYLTGFGVPPSSNADLAQQVTIEQLATHTAGFAKPGGFEAIVHEPGTAYLYSDGGANWLADVLTTLYHQDLAFLFKNRIGSKIGSAVSWRSNRYRPKTLGGVTRREFGSGITASADDLARLGLLLLRNGKWGTKQVLPASCDDLFRETPIAGTPVASLDKPNADDHYGLLWWNNADGWVSGVPTDAYWSRGLGDSYALVVPSKDLVVARVGKQWQSGSTATAVRDGFFQGVVAAIN